MSLVPKSDFTEAMDAMEEGRLAYVRSLKSEDVPSLFPHAPCMAPGLRLFALLSSDGTPIVLTDTKEAALANAWQNDLITVSVH